MDGHPSHIAYLKKKSHPVEIVLVSDLAVAQPTLLGEVGEVEDAVKELDKISVNLMEKSIFVVMI